MNLGRGLREEIYQQSLEHELSIRGTPFSTEKKVEVSYYKGQKLATKYIPDLVVFEEMIVELQTLENFTADKH